MAGYNSKPVNASYSPAYPLVFTGTSRETERKRDASVLDIQAFLF